MAIINTRPAAIPYLTLESVLLSVLVLGKGGWVAKASCNEREAKNCDNNSHSVLLFFLALVALRPYHH